MNLANLKLQPISSKPELITPLNTSHELKVTLGTLAVWRSTGRYNLPFVKVGSKVMYEREAIEAFKKSRTFNHTGEFSAKGGCDHE
ncbi:helix-turn-helix domain-containing protein [Colwelliaceae bacterium 6471]